ncbi:ABC transporter ATP-binding protein [Vaginisenegalia massiliensis]|uniref:ABC transporter ATP-binding protein n=1 Tax=Vaginisenegalia massiliensis TaxID=2058294 RepID=UPI000F5395DF|nr:ABC transporter ATP-binding protein [Vaginisenegalia massiliensis]
MKAIEFKDVSKTFKDGRNQIEALKSTNLVIEAGEFVAIIGPSGSGKSTFLTIAGGLQQPSTGQVLIKGQSLTDMKEKERTRVRFEEIGFILQSSNLVPFLTVKQQLQLVDKFKQTKKQALAHDLFEELGLNQLTDQYPNDLSGGERQRVAIARALYPEPAIILADEPTASLDTKRAFEVVELLARLSKEKQTAIVMVTHDERLISYCDRVLTMKDGQLTEED